MVNNLATMAELSDAELDMVAAGAIHTNSLVAINVPIAINVGVALANQANVAVFSAATQGGPQILSLSAIALNFA